MDIKSVQELKANPKIPPFGPGDNVRASLKVVEGERERIQAFEGVVLRVKEGGINSSFTVRRIASGVGVERTFFFHSPRLESVEVLRRGKVRRANLYYLRKAKGKAGRIKERRRERGVVVPATEQPEEATLQEPQVAAQEQPKAAVQEQPKAAVQEQPKAVAQEQPKAE